MIKWKSNNMGMVGFLSVIFFLVTIGSLIFFNNSSNLELNLKSNDEQYKEVKELNDALTNSLIVSNEMIKAQDSVILHYKTEMEKCATQKDSLSRIIRALK